MKRLPYLFLSLILGSAAAAAQTVAPPATTPPAPNQAAAPPAATPVARPPAAEDCGCEPAPLPDVLAVAGGVKLTAADLSPATREQVVRLQRQVVEARRRELDLQINSILLEAEAQRLGTTTRKLLETEVVAKSPEPTEAEAKAFYEENQARIGGDFEGVKARIVKHLRELRQQELARQLSARLRAAADLKVLVGEATPPAGAADRARLFATVNGRRITSGDVEDALRPLIFSVREQVYLARRRELDLKINDILLAQEAQRRQVTTRALLEAEVDAKVPPVTEAQALEFYQQNKERISGDFAQVKEQVMQYMKEAESKRLQVALAERLRKAAALQTFLVAPEPPVFDISTDDQPARGNPSAVVTVVEFTDFQCPNCAQAQSALDKLIGEYGDRARLVVRDFPLAQHAEAQTAAEAAEAAREQGKYWEYAALLFRNQSALRAADLKRYAGELGLDRARFDAALDGGRFTEKVQRDLVDGRRIGVNATPAIFVNGRRVSDRSYEGLKAAVEAALTPPGKP